jgi:antibiotic biosynthesis monooxygenase (ABM) superfamily enzyme
MSAVNPVVVVSNHRVAAGQESMFTVSVNSLLSMTPRSQGYLGGDLVRSPSDDSVWQIVCRFDSEEAADNWKEEASRSLWAGVLQRCALPADSQPVSRRPAGKQSTGKQSAAGRRSDRTDRPDKRAEPRAAQPKTGPPRWKMAVVTLIAVFPAVLGTNVIVISQLAGLSLIPRTFVLCVIVTILMTWVLMPRLMKLLGPWLRGGGQVPAEPVRPNATDEPRDVPSDDTTPTMILNPIPNPPRAAPATPRSRHRAASHRARPQPSGAPLRAATSPGRQVPTGRR